MFLMSGQGSNTKLQNDPKRLAFQRGHSYFGEVGLIILTLLGLKYLPGWVKLVWLFQGVQKNIILSKNLFFDGNLINIIVAKHYDSNAEVIDCSNIVWALHAMLVDNEVSLDRINKIINDVEVNRKNVCRILYFIYLCKIKLYIDRYLVFDYSNLYERIKQKRIYSVEML